MFIVFDAYFRLSKDWISPAGLGQGPVGLIKTLIGGKSK